MKLLTLAFVLTASLLGQDFVATKQTALTGAAEVITVQQPAASAKTVRFVGAYVDCSAACSVTVERNGTAATTTSLSVAKVNPSSSQAATAVAFSSSNVGTGTVVATYSLTAGGSRIIDLSRVYMTGTGTGKNLTLRTSSITGIVNILVQWTEAQ